MKKFVVILLILTLAASVLTGCAKKEEELTKVTFVLDWTPNTNHTGVYAALEEGYFEEEGLDVSIIQPGEGGADQAVASNAAQFGISYQEGVTFARAAGVPLVSLAAVIQHNTSGFASLADKNIESPKDFEGKKYGGWGSEIEIATIKYLMDQVGADHTKVEIVTTGDTDFFTASETGQVDFSWVFEGWTMIEAQLKGFDMNYIDLGKEAEVFDYYTPVIVTNENNIENNRELVESFMKAVKKGYEYAVKNPDEASHALLKHAPELDSDLVHKSQEFLSAKYKDDASYWGMQKKEVWQNYMKWLYDNGFIENEIDVEKAFTNEFVK